MGAHELVLPCARATSGVEKVLPFALRLVEFWVVAFCRMFSVFVLAVKFRLRFATKVAHSALVF